MVPIKRLSEANKSKATQQLVKSAKEIPTNKREVQIMKLCILTLLLTSILIIVLQVSISSEAKIIKLKDLKKAKKYAYLLAPQRKKLYAIPFPVPLPVFVKRQHIYTQVPVVPRYVQQPYYGGDTYDSYASMSSYSPDTIKPAQYHSSSSLKAKPEYAASGQQEQQYRQKHYASSPSKYLAQIANAMSYAYPTVLGSVSQRDVVGKLLSGQAKVLSPSQIRVGSILSSLKQQSLARPEQDNKSGSDNAGNQTASKPETGGDKPSASQLYMSSVRPASSPQYPMDFSAADLYRLSPNLFPYAPHFMAAQASMAPRYPPMIRAPHLNPHELMQVVDPNLLEAAQANSLESQMVQSQHEIQEPVASNNVQEYEMIEKHHHPDHLIETMQKVQQHNALRAALAREKEEARIAESNSIAISAHQFGVPVLPNQLRLVNY